METDKSMTHRERIAAFLEDHRGQGFSGEELAGQLGISRSAVWKTICSLREEGYRIEAVPHKGYCLAESDDTLSPQGIFACLPSGLDGLSIQVLPDVDSTNTRLRRLAEEGKAEGTVLVARRQTAGRGRYGHSFFSPDGTGLYMSLLLRPSGFTAESSTRLTSMAAVAVCRAIREVTGEVPSIRWVNDILLRGKKVGGILTEASFNLESGLVDWVILGIGLNVYPPKAGFPKDLQERAGSVLPSDGTTPGDLPAPDGSWPGQSGILRHGNVKNRLAAACLAQFMTLYRTPCPDGSCLWPFLDEYRAYSAVIGKSVLCAVPLSEQASATAGVREVSVLVTGIDDQGHLEVVYETGEKGVLSYGEIRLLS